MVSHLTFDDYYVSSYISKDGHLGFADFTPRGEDGYCKGKSYRHWRIDGQVFKSKKKFLQALENFELPKDETNKEPQ